MKRKKIPKLKLKLWQELIYFLFVGIVPSTVCALEVFQSHSSLFKITFASLGAILLTIVVFRKFVFKNYIHKLEEKCILLEHDYSIEVGNVVNIEAQWGKFKAIIYSYNALTTIISVALFVLFITALTNELIAFQGASIAILTSVLIGIVWKIILFIRRMLTSDKQDKQI